MSRDWMGIAEDLTENGVIGAPYTQTLINDGKATPPAKSKKGKIDNKFIIIGFIAAVVLIQITQFIHLQQRHASILKVIEQEEEEKDLELTLFDIQLRTASRSDIGRAIANAGGKLKTSAGDMDQYDATGIGLPGVEMLEVVYLQDRLVRARYRLTADDKQEMQIRKMLVSKYGLPKSESTFSTPKKFGDEYLHDGEYYWNFSNAMVLEFDKPFSPAHPKYLSYINKLEQQKLEQVKKDTDKRAAEKQAAAKNSVF